MFAHDAVEMPAIENTFELVLAGVFERQAGPRDEILHRGRYEDLMWTCESADSSSDMDGDAANVLVVEFDLARWTPALISKPRGPIGSDAAIAQRTARAGPSNVAKNSNASPDGTGRGTPSLS